MSHVSNQKLTMVDWVHEIDCACKRIGHWLIKIQIRGVKSIWSHSIMFSCVNGFIRSIQHRKKVQHATFSRESWQTMKSKVLIFAASMDDWTDGRWAIQILNLTPYLWKCENCLQDLENTTLCRNNVAHSRILLFCSTESFVCIIITLVCVLTNELLSF